MNRDKRKEKPKRSIAEIFHHKLPAPTLDPCDKDCKKCVLEGMCQRPRKDKEIPVEAPK